MFITPAGLIVGEAAGEGGGVSFVCVGEGLCVVVVMVAGDGSGR